MKLELAVTALACGDHRRHSLAAKRSIIIRDSSVLERIDRCRTIVLDKTGTLTYGEAALTDRFTTPGIDNALVLQVTASLEVVVIAGLLGLFTVAPSMSRFWPHHWATAAMLAGTVAVFGYLLVESLQYADRLLLRIQIIEQSRPPLR